MRSENQDEFRGVVMPEVADPDKLINELLERGEFARIDFGKMHRAIQTNKNLDKKQVAQVLQVLIDCECLDYFRNREPESEQKLVLHELLNRYAA